MLPVLLAMDAFGLYAFFHKIDRKVLLSLLPGGIAGTVLGTVRFGALDVNWVRVVVGVIAVSFPLMVWLKIGAKRPAAPLGSPGQRQPSSAHGAAGHRFWLVQRR